MRPRTPQELADYFQLFFFKQAGVWYGTCEIPDWNEKEGWVFSPFVEIILPSRCVLYQGLEKDSLFTPLKPKRA